MKIKRIIAAVTALVLIGGAYPATAGTVVTSAAETAAITDDGTVEKDGIVYEISDGKATLKKFSDRTLTDVVIPDDIDGIPVVGINRTQFTMMRQMKSVKLGDNITEIPEYGFEGLTELETIELGKGIETIGEYAFRNCNSLKNIVFSGGLKLIKHYAFDGCSSLVSVELPDSLEKIEYNAFEYCDNLESIKLGNGLEYLDENVFYGSTKLSDISFGENLKHIGYGAFHDYSISSLVLPESVEELEGCPLVGRGLTPDGKPITVVITNPDCVLLKPEWWKGYTIVCAKDSAVEKFAIENELTYMNIEETDTDENDYVSEGDGVLKYAETEGGLMVIGVEKLGKDGSIDIPDEVDGVPVVSIYNSIMGELLVNEMKSLRIGNNIKTVPAGLFSNCRALESVELGYSVETVESGAFYNCSALEKVTFNDGLKTIGNAAFSQCGIKNDLIFPDSLEVIEAGAFMHSGDFSRVVTGDNLISIGNAAFSGNTSLISAELNEGLTEIGESAFENCYLLRSVDIPSTLTSIEKKTFYNTVIEKLDLGKNIKSVGENAYHSLYSEDGEERVIEAANGLPEVTIPARPESVVIYVRNAECEIGKDAFTGGFDAIYGYRYSNTEDYCNSLEDKDFRSIGYVIDGNVNTYADFMEAWWEDDGVFIHSINADKVEGDTLIIPAEMFGDPVTKIKRFLISSKNGAPHIKNLIVEADIKDYEDGTFYGLGAIEKVEIGEGLVTLDYNDFLGKQSLKSVKLPDSLETIGYGAFGGCINLSDIQFGKGLKIIGENAFERCNSLTELTLPDSLETIDNSAFYECVNLKEVKCGAGLKTIGKDAFAMCYNLKKVTLNEGLESIGEMAFMDCFLLEEINIPNTVKKIETGTFADTSIRKLVLPESVEYVAKSALDYIPNKRTDEERTFYFYNGTESLFEDKETIIIPKYEGEVSITILNPECEFSTSSFIGGIDKVYGYWNSTASEMYGERYDRFVFESIGVYDKKKTNYLP